MSGRMPDIMPEYMSDRMSDRMSDNMSDRISENMSDRILDRLPDRMPGGMPEYMPDRMPEYMSDRMSEYIKHPDMSWWGSYEVKYFFGITNHSWKDKGLIYYHSLSLSNNLYRNIYICPKYL